MADAAPRAHVSENWVWISLAPLGLGSWAPLYAGLRAQRRNWIVLGAVWSVITLAGWVGASAHNGGAGAGLLIILGWTGAVATSFAIRSAYREAMASPFTDALHDAEERTTEREQARRLAREKPEVAREMGVGRPDLPGTGDGGLIDFNNVPASTLATLPGISADVAKQIVDARSATGFSSIEDVGAAVDLDSNLVESLRDRAVFLPRSS